MATTTTDDNHSLHSDDVDDMASCSDMDCWSEYECSCLYCSPEPYTPEIEDLQYEHKERGPVKGYPTGHTYRLESAAHHRQFYDFKHQPHLVKYALPGSTTPPSHDPDAIAHDINAFCDDAIDDGIEFRDRASMHNQAVLYSLNKRRRWLVPDRLDRLIDDLDVDESDYHITMAIRESKPVESINMRGKSYHSTKAGERRWAYARHCDTYADPLTLIDNVEPKPKYSKHDWKPELKKMTHNQHFRGVQRAQMLNTGYRRTLREILKKDADERVRKETNELAKRDKPEVVFDVLYAGDPTKYLPDPKRVLPFRVYHYGSRKPYVNRHGGLSSAQASKCPSSIKQDLDEYYDDLDDPEPFYRGQYTYQPEHVDHVPSATLADFILTSDRTKKRSRKRAQKTNETTFKYEPEKPSQPKERKVSEGHEYDSGVDLSPDNSQPERVEEFTDVPSPCMVVMPSEHLKPDYLMTKFGLNYTEGKSSPRRFSICVANSAIPSYVVFQVNSEYDVGLTEVLVQLHSEGANDFMLDLTMFDDLVTMDDVISSARSSIDLPQQNQDKLTVNSKVDMKKLNSVLGYQVSVHSRSEALQMQQTQAQHEPEHRRGSSTFITEAVYCDICYRECWGENYSNRWTSLDRCGHVFCNQCWSNHLTVSIRRRDTELLCPAYDCTSDVDSTTVLSLVDEKTFVLYEKLSREVRLEKSPDWQWCPNTKCGRVVHKENADVRFGLNISCTCGSIWCFSCQGPAHWPCTCKQAEEYAENLKQVGAAVATYTSPISSVNVKRCPVCKYPIEKHLGCNQMVCGMCRTWFCWLCRRTGTSLIHDCKISTHETVDLIDVLPKAMRWFNDAVERRFRWQTQDHHIIRKIKMHRGIANKKYNGHFRRRVFSTAIGREALAAARLYNHVIEHVMVVWMSCRRRNIVHELKWAFENLNFVTEGLESIVVSSCAVGKISAQDQHRVRKFIEFGNKMLLTIKSEMRRQQGLVKSLNQEKTEGTSSKT